MPFVHAAMHTLMLGLTALLIFEIYLLIAPKLPFSEQRKQQRSAITSVMYMMLVAIIPGSFLTLIIHLAYSNTNRFWMYAALLATITFAAHFFVRRRLEVKLESQEYTA
jgi:drug/metabolite transporter (DMT)-like permease